MNYIWLCIPLSFFWKNAAYAKLGTPLNVLAYQYKNRNIPKYTLFQIQAKYCTVHYNMFTGVKQLLHCLSYIKFIN